MTDFTARRRMMVDTQVRPSDVTKFPIIDAMLNVAREEFVPGAQREAAYMGENIDLAPGRVLLEPRTLAKMLDALDVQGGELVMDIAPGHGYSSAVIARLAQAVVAVEEDESMAREAQETLNAQNADNVMVHVGALAGGAPEHAPFDAIILQGGVEQIPDAVSDQLKEGGRICALFIDGAMGDVKIGYKIDGQISWRRSFHAGAPVLPGFEKTGAFAL